MKPRRLSLFVFGVLAPLALAAACGDPPAAKVPSDVPPVPASTARPATGSAPAALDAVSTPPAEDASTGPLASASGSPSAVSPAPAASALAIPVAVTRWTLPADAISRAVSKKMAIAVIRVKQIAQRMVGTRSAYTECTIDVVAPVIGVVKADPIACDVIGIRPGRLYVAMVARRQADSAIVTVLEVPADHANDAAKANADAYRAAGGQ